MRSKFFEKVKNVHGDRYDYSKVEYKDHYTKVIIICKDHGEFLQTPNAHLHGQGCKKCGALSRINKRTFTTEKFIERATKMHGDLYDYSKSKYEKLYVLVEIICKIHGSFWQRPNDHWKGCGCNECAIELRAKNISYTTEEFIEQVKLNHTIQYDYSKVEYKGRAEKVCIICPNHGEFWQKASFHVAGSDCPKCAYSSSISKKEVIWLDSLNIKEDNRQYRITINANKKHFVDGYDPITNTVYEYNGMFWHGHPSKHNPSDYNERAKVTFGELYQKTLKKEQDLKDAGYNVVTKWGR